MTTTLDDLRAKLERATERVKAHIAYDVERGVTHETLVSQDDLRALLDQAARVKALEGALRMCADRLRRPEMSPDANVVLERALRALDNTSDAGGPWSVFATMNGQRTRLVLPGNPDSPYQTPYRDAAERFVETLRDLSPAYTDVRIEPALSLASTTPPAKD